MKEAVAALARQQARAQKRDLFEYTPKVCKRRKVGAQEERSDEGTLVMSGSGSSPDVNAPVMKSEIFLDNESRILNSAVPHV